MEESGRRRGPTDAASAVNVNLEAKSSLSRVSTCIQIEFTSYENKWVNFFYKQIALLSKTWWTCDGLVYQLNNWKKMDNKD